VDIENEHLTLMVHGDGGNFSSRSFNPRQVEVDGDARVTARVGGMKLEERTWG
jgi:hypothetical protein